MTTLPPSSRYIGRFAPSPTGPLHFGSLVAAAASYLDARAKNGQWLLRMEDIDAPRCSAESAAKILRSLERFGFVWDGPVVYQSQRQALYQEAFTRLAAAGWIYPCGCSRREIAAPRYPGTCRNGLQGRSPRAYRVRVEADPISFRDRLQGDWTTDLEAESGDFVVLRADGLWAYQLAVVVDDHEQGVTHIVRGADLLDSTPRQIHLQRLLGFPTPSYLHLPVAVDERGEKLSKQSGAPAIDDDHPGPAIHRALSFLNQTPPPEAVYATATELWSWAAAHWDPHRIPPQRSRPLS